MAYIYKITNTINQKVYIGKTCRTISERFREHKIRAKNNVDTPLYRAMNKYGIDNFIIEQIEETNMPNEREIYWIKYYNSYSNDGYNATAGGDGRLSQLSQDQVEQIIKMYNNKVTILEISKILHLGHQTISTKLKELGFEVDHNLFRKKQIYQLDKKTNKILNTFNSIGDAARFLGDVSKSSHISQCCKGSRKTAYGFKWIIKNDIEG